MPKTRLNRFDQDEVNRALLSVEDRIDGVLERLERLRSGKLAFSGDIDLGNFRITNTGGAESDDDPVTLGELRDRILEVEEEELQFETSAAEDVGGGAKAGRLARRTSRLRTMVDDAAAAGLLGAVPSAAPPEVEDASAIGTTSADPTFALEDHTHSGMNLSDAQTAAGIKTFSSGVVVSGGTLDVGGSSEFQVASADGDLQVIKSVSYDWPAANAAGALNNDGAGTLSWSAPTPAAHDILSTQHGDTLAAVVLQGSLIVGNSTPAWSELTIGGANTILGSDGTDATWQAQSFIDHGSIGGRTDDDHTQYLLLAGRSGGQAASGGAGTSSDSLTLRANTAAQAIANTGRIRLNERGVLWEDVPDLGLGDVVQLVTFDAAASLTDGTAVSITQLRGFVWEPSLTLDTASAVGVQRITPIFLSGTMTHSEATTLNVVEAVGVKTDWTHTFTGTGATLSGGLFLDKATLSAASGITTLGQTYRSFSADPTYQALGTGTLTVSDATGFRSQCRTVTEAGSAVNITTYTDFFSVDVSDTGPNPPTITTRTGLFIADFTNTTTPRSIVSEGASVFMLHAGPVRIGDNTTPTEKLEVLGNLLLDNSGSSGELRIREPSAGGLSYTGFLAPALAGNVMYTLPTADGSSGQQLTTNGSGVLSWAAAGGSGGLGTHIFARFTGTDTRTSDTTFANANDGTFTLQFAVGTSETWVFTAVLRMSVAATAPDMKVQFTGPATVTAFAAGVSHETGLTGGKAHMNALSTSSDIIPLANATKQTILISGMIVTDGTNSGNVTLQWAQNSSNANTVTMAATSFIHAQQIA